MAADIIFVDHSAQMGGAELALSRYLKWADRTYSVDVVLFEDGPLAEVARECADVSVTVLGAQNLPQRVKELNSHLKGSKAPVIANSLSAFMHLSLAPRSTGRLIDFLRQEAFPPQAPRLKNLYLKYCAYPRTKAFLANSAYSLNTLGNTRQIARGQVVYTVSGFDADRVVESPRTFSEPLRLLSLSRLSPWKGVDVIMQAVNIVNESVGSTAVTLTVAGGNLFGEPEYSQRLEDLTQASKGTITMVGNVKDVSGLLNTHDVLVSASVEPEPFGQVLVQGLCAGLLTIGTSHGGATEIIEDSVNGLMTAPGDAQDLASRLLWVLEHPREIQQIREAGIASAHRFTDNRTLPLLDDAIGRLNGVGARS